MTGKPAAGTSMTASGSATRSQASIHRLDAPRPGTYWRARKAIDQQSDQRRDTYAIEEGEVLLLSQIEEADGEPLVYIFAPHPSLPKRYQDGNRFHADDFYDCFEPAPDGEDVRQQELLAHLRDMEETKALMMSSPPDSVPAGLLSHDPSEQVGAPGKELATTDQVNAMVAHAQRLKEDAERRSSWITTHSEKLGQQGKVLANFHQERATAALARAQEQLEGVKALLRTVDNLRLYTGEGIESMLLREGIPAAPDELITIYQDVLSFDEETLILLDQGGADHTKVESIAEALKDPALLSRMIPAARGMTLVRFRAKSKEFIRPSGDNDLLTRLYNDNMSTESKRLRLLVRDGERLSLLDIPEVLQGITQLMPSTAEQDSYFTEKPRSYEWSLGPRRITRDDLDFARARKAQMGALDSYGKVLIALWGLYDRGEIFTEGGPMPRFSNWLDPAIMDRYLKLVSLDSMLGEDRPSYAEWRREQNRYFAPGCMVAVHVSRFHTTTNLPAAYSRGDNQSQVYELEDKQALRHGLIGRVQADSTGLYVSVPMRYKGYKRNPRRASIDAKLYLQFHGETEVSDSLLVIDRIHASDLSYYLQSRTQRRAYSQYVQLFELARQSVEARDAGEAPIRVALLEALREGRIPHDPDEVDRHVTAAIAIARTARKAQDIPAPGTPAFKSFMDAALDALYAATTGDAKKIEALEGWASNNNRKLLRFVLSGKRRHRIYMVPTESEHDSRIGEATHASSADVAFFKDGSLEVGEISRELLRARTKELVIKDWEWTETEVTTQKPDKKHVGERKVDAGASAWLKKTPPFKASYVTALEALSLGARQSARYEAGIDPRELAEQATRFSRRMSKGYVKRMDMAFAIGSGFRQYRNDAPVVLFAVIDAWEFAYLYGDDEVKAEVKKMIGGRYAHPEGHLSGLPKLTPESAWKVSAVDIDVAAKRRDNELCCEIWQGWRLSKESVRGKSDGMPSARVTAITAAGAKLFPWLLAVAERGLDP